MRVLIPFLLCLGLAVQSHGQALTSAPPEPCDDCEWSGWPVSLLSGDVRLGLASPDGAYLAVIGGSGKAGTDHSLVVVRGGCAPDSLQILELSRHGGFPVPPKDMPADFVRVQWSADSRYLFALGSTYRLTPLADGAFTAVPLRTFDEPFLDFRFGPGRYAAGIVFLSAGEQQTRGDGQRNFAVHTDYRLLPLTSPRDSQIPKRERGAYVWVPPETVGEPALSWDEDWVLLYTPMGKTVERFKPPAKRQVMTTVRPTPRTPVSPGPWPGPCDLEWELRVDGGEARVRLRTGK